MSYPPDNSTSRRLRVRRSEAPAYLGISQRQLDYRIANKELRTVRDGDAVFITMAELRRYATTNHPPIQKRRARRRSSLMTARRLFYRSKDAVAHVDFLRFPGVITTSIKLTDTVPRLPGVLDCSSKLLHKLVATKRMPGFRVGSLIRLCPQETAQWQRKLWFDARPQKKRNPHKSNVSEAK